MIRLWVTQFFSIKWYKHIYRLHILYINVKSNLILFLIFISTILFLLDTFNTYKYLMSNEL